MEGIEVSEKVARKMPKILAKAAITIILASLSLYVLRNSWIDRKIAYEEYSYTREEAEKLKDFPEAMYDYGRHSKSIFDYESARFFFQRAALGNVFHGDAWISLAETEARLGNTERAGKILLFLDDLSKRTVRWKWRQALLARELGMEELFLGNIRFLMERKHRIDDFIQVLDFHVGRKPDKVLSFLEDSLYPAYLRWLVRWKRTEDAMTVWREMGRSDVRDRLLTEDFVHFLLEEKLVVQAAEIRKSFLNIEGMTNPGFEDSLTKKGFDWRYWGENKGGWTIDRISRNAAEGEFALRILFTGKENLNFLNLYQIVKADPLTMYTLSYRYRSSNITTDQGPYVEVYCKDAKGLHAKGRMIAGTALWTREEIEFETPENCDAVVVRLRRNTSKRIDCKIKGELWLDDFAMQATDTQERDEKSER